VEKAKSIYNNITEVIKLIGTIQASVQSPNPEKINLHDVLHEAISAVSMSTTISHRWSCEQIVAEVFGLRRQLKQVFRVIIYNAQNAMAGEGTISYCLRNEIRDKIAYVLVSITDTGIGIPEQLQPYVFAIGSQFQAARSFSFGLAWARLFLRWYGGDIWFETVQGKGTTMYVLIPHEFIHKKAF
jgi:two-component system sensor histidine kinase VicK